jgi:hypothetical protein
MGMKIPPPFLDLTVQIGDAIDYRHGKKSLFCASRGQLSPI